MNVEILILAFASTFRVASLAAIYALLQRENPRRLLVAYIAAGLVFVFAVGAIVVVALHGVDYHHGNHGFRRVAELVAGGALLILALAAFAGRLPTDAPGDRRAGSWSRRLDEDVGPRGAALAGVLTHVPGVFYLVALDLILSNYPNSTLRGLKETALFDAVWFALPIAVLIAVVLRPARARAAVDAVRSFASRNAPQLIGAISAVLGLVLIFEAVS